MLKRLRKRKSNNENSSNEAAADNSVKKTRNAKRGDSSDNSEEQSDPYDLVERFVVNQEDYFLQALAEIKQGRKRTHWLWFMLPTPPYIVNGKECGSETNRYFVLRDDAPKAYLKMKPLRSNYVAICQAMECQLKFGNSLQNIFGPYDCPKVISSLMLFKKTALQLKDDELATLCSSLLAMEEEKNNPSKPSKR